MSCPKTMKGTSAKARTLLTIWNGFQLFRGWSITRIKRSDSHPLQTGGMRAACGRILSDHIQCTHFQKAKSATFLSLPLDWFIYFSLRMSPHCRRLGSKILKVGRACFLAVSVRITQTRDAVENDIWPQSFQSPSLSTWLIVIMDAREIVPISDEFGDRQIGL